MQQLDYELIVFVLGDTMIGKSSFIRKVKMPALQLDNEYRKTNQLRHYPTLFQYLKNNRQINLQLVLIDIPLDENFESNFESQHQLILENLKNSGQEQFNPIGYILGYSEQIAQIDKYNNIIQQVSIDGSIFNILIDKEFQFKCDDIKQQEKQNYKSMVMFQISTKFGVGIFEVIEHLVQESFNLYLKNTNVGSIKNKKKKEDCQLQ